jgi:membrane dipeptidase
MKKTAIIDGHNDTLTRLFGLALGGERAFFEGSFQGHIDLPRAQIGGFSGGFFAIMTPPPPDSPERDVLYGLTIDQHKFEIMERSAIDPAYVRDYVTSVMNFARQLEGQSNGQLQIIRDYRQLEYALNHDILSVILQFEGAEAIDEKLTNLDDFFGQGLRSLGPVWSRPNVFGYGVPFRYPGSPDTGPGLTSAGKNLIKACNELGIIIDLAHINERGFWDVAAISKAPLVVSHSAVHSLCASSRNITDQQIDAVASSGGVIGIIYEPAMIRFKVTPDNIPDLNMPLSDIVRHIDFIVERVGIDHVAFGSDFDGTEMPLDLKDAAGLPRLIEALRDAGYDDASIEKIACNNWLRVIKETWK